MTSVTARTTPGICRMLRSITMLFLLSVGAGGLRDVRVSVPEAVAAGDTVSLHCRYDLETDLLYSVKWYRGRQEFFRYIPKELPHTRVFLLPGMDVDVGRSGPASVMLRAVIPSLSGRYRCEVSADAPSFHTVMKNSYMHVVEVPSSPPSLVAERPRVAPGDLLRAQCSAPAAYPPANLTWMLNGHTINGTTLEHLPGENAFYKHSPKTSTNNIQQFTTINSAYYQTSYSSLASKNKFLTDIASSSDNSTNSENLEVSWRYSEGASAEQAGGMAENAVVKKKSVSTLVLVVQQEFLRQGALKLTCRATLFSLYSAQAELLLTAERPQTAPVLVLATGHTHSRGVLFSGSFGVVLGLLLTFGTLGQEHISGGQW